MRLLLLFLLFWPPRGIKAAMALGLHENQFDQPVTGVVEHSELAGNPGKYPNGRSAPFIGGVSGRQDSQGFQA